MHNHSYVQRLYNVILMFQKRLKKQLFSLFTFIFREELSNDLIKNS